MRRIGFIASESFQVMSLAALPAFEFANLELPSKSYSIEMLSEHGGLIRSSDGIGVATEPFGDPMFDTLIVGGPTCIDDRPSASLLDFVRRGLANSRRLTSISSGAFILAEAGVLDGRHATTHWFAAAAFRERYPRVLLQEDRIFTVDGSIWTSAGMTAGIDLALALIEQDLGRDVARMVAKKLVVYHRRSGGQSQYSTLLELDPKSDRMQTVLSFARRNLTSVLSVEKLASAAGLSPRQFSRAFRAETGHSPAKAVEMLRLEAAKLMLDEGHHAIEEVARETGFADRERMRRAFQRAYGQPPQKLKRAARESSL